MVGIIFYSSQAYHKYDPTQYTESSIVLAQALLPSWPVALYFLLDIILHFDRFLCSVGESTLTWVNSCLHAVLQPLLFGYSS